MTDTAITYALSLFAVTSLAAMVGMAVGASRNQTGLPVENDE